MKKPNNQISLEIKNNLSNPSGVLVMNNLFNPNNQANATNYYEWDLSTESFIGVSSITITYYNVGSLIPIIKTTPLFQLNVNGVADSLSLLNMGFFFSSGNLVYTYNDNYVFGNIVIS